MELDLKTLIDKLNPKRRTNAFPPNDTTSSPTCGTTTLNHTPSSSATSSASAAEAGVV